MNYINKNKRLHKSRNLLAALTILSCVFSTPSFAHDPGYQDFYNTAQGTMTADSGCRLLLCLANPKGPMSEAACVQDVQSMYTEIALTATVWHGPAWIPQCTGLNGLSMMSQINSLGQSAGSYATFNRFRVERCMDRGEGGCIWEPIYTSTRTPVYFPVNGKTSKDPVQIWNAKSKTTQQMLSSTDKNNTGSIDKVLSSDINKVVEDETIDIFAGKDYSNISVERFEEAVIAYTDDAIFPTEDKGVIGYTGPRIITSRGPAGSDFIPGDRIVIAKIATQDGGNPSARKAPLTSIKVKSGRDVDTVTPVFGIVNGQKTQDIVDYTINGESLGGFNSAVVVNNQAYINNKAVEQTPIQIDENKNSLNYGVVTYSNADGTQTSSTPFTGSYSDKNADGTYRTITVNPTDYIPTNTDPVIK